MNNLSLKNARICTGIERTLFKGKTPVKAPNPNIRPLKFDYVNNCRYNTLMFYTLPILKPIFMAIARQPLIGPHGREEANLLLSGSKQVAMFSPLDPQAAKLQKDVDEGRLVRTDVKRNATQSYTFYGLPGTDLDDISSTHKTMWESAYKGNNDEEAERKWRNHVREHKIATYDEASSPISNLKKVFFKAAYMAADLIPKPIENSLNIKSNIRTRLTRLNVEEFLDGKRDVLNARDYKIPTLDIPPDLAEQLNHKVEDGQIQCKKTDCTVNSDMIIFGQPGQEKNMDDLSFILKTAYFDNEALKHNTRGLTQQSEGQILGYSDQDIKYYQHRASFSRLHQFALNSTHEIRRDIRIGLMKEMGSSWNRNM